MAHQIRLIRKTRKTSLLKPPDFDCLKGVPTINITRGCSHSCIYCYARGFVGAPPKGEVHLYRNIPEMLEKELESKRRLPSWVSFSTASDAFQNIDEVLSITHCTMKLLLERGIGISFLTKGFIPFEFIELFKDYPHLIKARIGIVSLNEDYRRLFEPFSAHPVKRLSNIKSLVNADIDVSVRIDPIIPMTTDSEETLEHLINRLGVIGVTNISVSYLVMRHSIMNQFISELPFGIAKDIIRLYSDQPWQRVITSARTRLLPKTLREVQYQNIKNIANRYGIDCRICGCKNPDLLWEFCSPWVDGINRSNVKQLGLFA